jgi:Mg-chelatase subunit ChlI
MTKYCLNCGFDLSSVAVKNTTDSVINKNQQKIAPEDNSDDDLITKISKNLILKNGKVKVQQTEKQRLALEKARESRRLKTEERKKLKEQNSTPQNLPETPQQTPQQNTQPKPQQNAEYTNFYNLF